MAGCLPHDDAARPASPPQMQMTSADRDSNAKVYTIMNLKLHITIPVLRVANVSRSPGLLC